MFIIIFSQSIIGTQSDSELDNAAYCNRSAKKLIGNIGKK